jgi:hypothetical protein
VGDGGSADAVGEGWRRRKVVLGQWGLGR